MNEFSIYSKKTLIFAYHHLFYFKKKKCAIIEKIYIFPLLIIYASTFGLPDKEDNLEVKCHGFTVRLVNSENDV